MKYSTFIMSKQHQNVRTNIWTYIYYIHVQLSADTAAYRMDTCIYTCFASV